MTSDVTILTGPPQVEVLAEMKLDWNGIHGMGRWVKQHRPECLAEKPTPADLFPHGGWGDGQPDSDNELLAELAGRKCYDSFGAKAGRKNNKEYLEHAAAHASIFYHAKMTFFIAGVSRRLSHELIRNYVGADRDEEGSPSQESTRYTEHYGFFVAPPMFCEPGSAMLAAFKNSMTTAYDEYRSCVVGLVERFKDERTVEPKGLDRKRLYEAAAALLPGAAETSFIWTTNPAALAKLFRERGAPEADAEFRRLVNDVWKPLCLKRWPNLFPGLT